MNNVFPQRAYALRRGEEGRGYKAGSGSFRPLYPFAFYGVTGGISPGALPLGTWLKGMCEES